jgi:hypothetical protein
MLRKTGIMFLLLPAVLGTAFADLPDGFEININLGANAFELIKTEKSDEELRTEAGRNTGQTIAWPFGGSNWHTDTNFSIAYDGGFFGGTLGICVEENLMVKASTIRAWVSLFGGTVKITGGVDIPANYADSLDADPGMRIYYGGGRAEWDHARDPDNITQDEGVLVEGFIGPVTLALAGRYYIPSLFTKSLNPNDPVTTARNTKYASMDQTEYSFGARVGSEIGGWGKVNASYILEYSNLTGDNYSQDRDNVLVPTTGDAEITAHLFGVYASLTPLKDLGVSLGYNGIITKYVDQIYENLGGGSMHNITLPKVYQQAVNLNLRYKGVPRWTFRTDHNLSFWTDKNYTIFGFNAPKDLGIVSQTQSSGFADVDHLLLWNGLGLGFQLTDSWKIELYTRNLYRQDTAKGRNGREELRFARNKLCGELKGIWQPNDRLELFFGVVLENELTTISEDTNKRLVGSVDGFGSAANVAETGDTVFTVKIPVGVILKMR